MFRVQRLMARLHCDKVHFELSDTVVGIINVYHCTRGLVLTDLLPGLETVVAAP